MILVRRGGRLNGQLVGLDEWVKWGVRTCFAFFVLGLLHEFTRLRRGTYQLRPISVK